MAVGRTSMAVCRVALGGRRAVDRGMIEPFAEVDRV